MNCEFRLVSEDAYECVHCGFAVRGAKGIIIAECKKESDAPRPHMAKARPSTVQSRRERCAGCDLFKADRGTEKPICTLIDCPCGPSPEKPILLLRVFEDLLENAQASCLLKENSKWGPETPAAKSAPKDYCQMNAHGAVIDADEIQQPP
jgi:hypothetical protein